MSTDKHPIVSVIIPVFNGAQYIRDAVESVLGQTFKDVEIIMRWMAKMAFDGALTMMESKRIGPGLNRYLHPNEQKVGSITRNAELFGKRRVLEVP